eukprot:TRINITY_DN60140_c0_g1_i1.p1 TRINITY_DN60140_c0_g1~~TRINITY_DN60140_c0_g1_i1.p1  ORF type:complete len:281 (+),score=58.13 TRINITY_DN60140_c0_g1_i1:193-1035(+)
MSLRVECLHGLVYGTEKPRDDASLDEDRMSFGPTTSSFIGLTSLGSERPAQMTYTSDTYRKETPQITDSMFASLCTVEARSRFYNWLHHDFGVTDQYIMEREFEVLLAYFTDLPFHRIRLIMDCFDATMTSKIPRNAFFLIVLFFVSHLADVRLQYLRLFGQELYECLRATGTLSFVRCKSLAHGLLGGDAVSHHVKEVAELLGVNAMTLSQEEFTLLFFVFFKNLDDREESWDVQLLIDDPLSAISGWGTSLETRRQSRALAQGSTPQKSKKKKCCTIL